MNKLFLGLGAGGAATVPMTAVLKYLLKDAGPRQSARLPPRQITSDLATAAHLDHHLTESRHHILATLSHYGYGTAAGAVYAGVHERVPGPPLAKGAVFGLLVWAASYLGWLPALGSSAAASEQTVRRNWIIILAHLVWGMSLALLLARLDQE